jgi:hypothetical protein
MFICFNELLTEELQYCLLYKTLEMLFPVRCGRALYLSGTQPNMAKDFK